MGGILLTEISEIRTNEPEGEKIKEGDKDALIEDAELLQSEMPSEYLYT